MMLTVFSIVAVLFGGNCVEIYPVGNNSSLVFPIVYDPTAVYRFDASTDISYCLFIITISIL